MRSTTVPLESLDVTRGLLFDLYGTLLEIGDPVFQEQLPRIEGISRRDWVGFQRDELLIRPYPTRAAFVGAIFERFGGGSEEITARLLELLAQELESVVAVPGALSVLSFLKRRGLRLGLVTNSASPYREPLDRLGLADLFDDVVFSCDAGARKPASSLYRQALDALALPAREALMVGDSLANDVRGPEELGVRGLLVGSSSRARCIQRLADFGWLDLETLEPLIPEGAQLHLGAARGRLTGLEPLEDADQGRYNLVARARLLSAEEGPRTVYLKRFLLPESIGVERFVAELVGICGVPTCATGVVDTGAEPVLAVAAAPGTKLGDPMPVAPYAREVGRHAAMAYIFANADLRPRNAFVAGAGEALQLTMVDYEHCLLNLAIDLEGIPDPLDRDAFEARGREELERRVVRRVLADAHMRRAYRSFLGPFAKRRDLAEAFRTGWLGVHREAQARRSELVERLEARLTQNPPLVVGTHAYRRAFLRLDLEDLLARLDEVPNRACDRCF